MKELLTISAKKQGCLSMPIFCPRCFWICERLTGKVPYSIFPQIFSAIDLYSKRLIHSYFDRHKKFPGWMAGLGQLAGYIEPPSHAKLIADYKTALPKGSDDPLFPIYSVQLNCYALLAAHTNLGTADKLALIYTTPDTARTQQMLTAIQWMTALPWGTGQQLSSVPRLGMHPEACKGAGHSSISPFAPSLAMPVTIADNCISSSPSRLAACPTPGCSSDRVYSREMYFAIYQAIAKDTNRPDPYS